MDMYEEMAEKFCKKNSVKVDITFKAFDNYFPNEATKRNIYDVTLERNGEVYKFTFGDSVANTEHNIKPTAYDVLACLTKYDVGTIEDFCSSYGYEGTEKGLGELYRSVKNEYENVFRLFHDIMDEFAEID